MPATAIATPATVRLAIGPGTFLTDIRSQESVLKTGALQDAILNSANFSSIATDEKGVIQIFNVGAERMLGYTADDVLNRITPADISDPQEVIARAKALSVELGTPITPGFEALVFKASRGIEDIYELTYIRKDGSRFPAVVSVTALRDRQDAIIGYLLIGTDNTARKQIEAEQKRLENSQRMAGLGAWEYDYANHRLIWSEEIYRILGISRRNFPPNAATFDRLVHPDDLLFVQREKNTATEGSRHAEFEHRIIRPDGAVRWLHQITEMSFDDEGQPVQESGTIQDVTDRKLADEALRESEERFKFVARAVSDVVWDWNLSTNAFWWNDGFLTTFGFVAGEIEPNVESWTGRIHLDERRRVVDSIDHAIDAGAESWGAEYRVQRKDGSYALVQDRGFILRDAAGRAVRMVGGMRDLTEQKKMEAQYLRALRMESIGTLAGGIAHDLNNVLAPIVMSIELLRLSVGQDPRLSKILDTIYANSRRGTDLVRQVLSFARGLDGQRVAIRLRRLIDDLVGIIGATFPHNIRIVAQVPKDLWPITGDPTQLHQVLLNLAVNARDAMPHGGTLTLTATNLTIDAQYAGMSQEAKAGPHVLLQVTDTGHGMPPEVRERIFEPFFTTKELGKGTGIGLATVHTVVKSHGGFLNVESEVGRGTTFKIYLPADPTLRAEDPASVPIELPRGRNELVLVVDDEFSIRDITQQTLEAFGYRVITASDGAEAIALYAKQGSEIAVVLTDMIMPIMDGVATIQVLLRINPAVRIIAASGIDSGDTVAQASNAGVKHFLLKPYTTETLLKLFREILDRSGSPAAR